MEHVDLPSLFLLCHVSLCISTSGKTLQTCRHFSAINSVNQIYDDSDVSAVQSPRWTWWLIYRYCDPTTWYQASCSTGCFCGRSSASGMWQTGGSPHTEQVTQPNILLPHTNIITRMDWFAQMIKADYRQTLSPFYSHLSPCWCFFFWSFLLMTSCLILYCDKMSLHFLKTQTGNC